MVVADAGAAAGTAEKTTLTFTVAPAVAAAAVPTLTEWGVIGLSGLLMLLGVSRLRTRQSRAASGMFGR